jgi:hypothetical protein
MGSCINFIGTSVLDRTSVYVDRLVKEAVETLLNKNNFNRDGFILSQAWSPVTNMFINARAGPSRVGT